MDVTTAIIGKRVWVEDDYLNVEGGAWAYLDVPALPVQATLTLGLVLIAEQEEDIVLTEVRIGVAGPDGQIRPDMQSVLVSWPHPADPVPGQPVVVPLALPVALDILEAGRHTIVVFLEGSDSNRAAVPFAVRVRPEASTP